VDEWWVESDENVMELGIVDRMELSLSWTRYLVVGSVLGHVQTNVQTPASV